MSFFVLPEVAEAVLEGHVMEETADSSQTMRNFACTNCGAGAFYDTKDGTVRGRATLLGCGE